MVGVNEVGIRWKDNALIRGGLTDASNIFFYERRYPCESFNFSHGYSVL